MEAREVRRDSVAVRPSVPEGPYLVVGLGRAGMAAAESLMARAGPDSVRVWDDSPGPRVRTARAALASRGISWLDERSLDCVRTVVKSPGIYPDHWLLAAAIERGLPIIDELELGWRLGHQPLVAVTGTNGKSTTVELVAAALRACGRNPLLAGNVEAARGVPLSAVPPCHNGWVVAEVSSYQLAMAPELLPSAAVFTNLTQDHLHWHGSMDAYAAAKRRLFIRGRRAVELAVVNVDNPFGRKLALELTRHRGRVLTYGRSPQCDYRVLGIEPGTVELATGFGTVRVATRLPGHHNAENIAAALALADGLHLPRPEVLGALAVTDPLPGRFEQVEAGQPFDVVVDFAHTPDAIHRTLATARSLARTQRARMIVVMAGIARGERRTREAAGREARAGSDHLILCASSLHGEPPLIALEGLLRGARSVEHGSLEVVLDRRAAIARAISLARVGDSVLILGRGATARCSYGVKAPPGSFDDRAVARELLAARSRPV